jgi:ATP-dependent DNA ligase
MLCKRPGYKVEDMVKELNSPVFIIEEKLDGERMQIHKRGNEYYYCSRSSTERRVEPFADTQAEKARTTHTCTASTWVSAA